MLVFSPSLEVTAEMVIARVVKFKIMGKLGVSKLESNKTGVDPEALREGPLEAVFIRNTSPSRFNNPVLGIIRSYIWHCRIGFKRCNISLLINGGRASHFFKNSIVEQQNITLKCNLITFSSNN